MNFYNTFDWIKLINNYKAIQNVYRTESHSLNNYIAYLHNALGLNGLRSI